MSNVIPVSKLQDWLRHSLSSDLTQVERERDKLVSEISRALDSLREFCSQLSAKAEQDMESKRDNRAQFRAAKSVAKLTNMIKEMSGSLSMPTTKDSVSLRNLQRETSKLASETSRARLEWLRLIRPYYIIDMMTLGGNIDKARRLGEELHSFLVGRGSLLRSLEDLQEKIESLDRLQASRGSVSSHRLSIEQKLEEAEEREKSLRAQVEEVRRNPKMKEYLQIDSELKALRTELLRTGFSRLGRPLRKLVSISERGDYPLRIDVRENVKEYVKKPFTTFLQEQDGYPNLKAVFSTLSEAVSSGKLALKQREAKKVIERSEQVVSGDSLANMHAKSKDLKKTYDEFLADSERATLVERLGTLRGDGRANRALQEELKAELERASANERRFNEQIGTLVKEIETFSRKLSGTNVKLQVS